MTKERKGFDLSKYQINHEAESVTLSIESTGDEFDVTIKELSWAKRNKLISNCLTFDGAGKTAFDGDKYIRECLKELIVDAPWGKTTEAFLITINAELGTALESLVPKAFGEDQGVDADAIKKE
tara:strand:+ start:2503 stop:2874 length:372 start_codon:yes stop_codon:yes gene_type:complete